MTAAPAAPPAGRLKPELEQHAVWLLERDFGRLERPDAVLANQVLLDALDRGERERFLVWPAAEPRAVLYISTTGTLVPAGDPGAGAAFAGAAERAGWRVLVGDASISEALLDSYPRGLFRRRAHGREQRFMTVRTVPDEPARPSGFRRATYEDVPILTDFACALHVEDQMGPPLARSTRPAVRARMADSVARGLTYVVERDRRVVAKFDLSLHSRDRGAQIAGVFVSHDYRGLGITSGAVAAIARDLLADGLPGVTLHVRADNVPAIAAYRRAGFTDRGSWTLALR
ncbi:MAG: GNAT family N-acetyltransferase [Nitriliruptorales bacterium]|nr:GNAT family N-acetyltransferase [Nitriliruptorales bacterium]